MSFGILRKYEPLGERGRTLSFCNSSILARNLIISSRHSHNTLPTVRNLNSVVVDASLISSGKSRIKSNMSCSISIQLSPKFNSVRLCLLPIAPIGKVLNAKLILVSSVTTGSTLCSKDEGNKIKSPVVAGIHHESELK